MIFPRQFITLNDLESPPEWVFWLFAQMAARFIGYGVGMFAVAKDPVRNRLWTQTMIAIQAIDWFSTIFYLFNGSVTLIQVSTAPLLPIIFIIILIKYGENQVTINNQFSTTVSNWNIISPNVFSFRAKYTFDFKFY